VRSSFCEQKEAKKLFNDFGDSRLSAPPPSQGDWFFGSFFQKGTPSFLV
jgi:hypothetical protein